MRLFFKLINGVIGALLLNKALYSHHLGLQQSWSLASVHSSKVSVCFHPSVHLSH